MDSTTAAVGVKPAPSSPRAAAPESVPRQQEPFPSDAAATVDTTSATATTSTADSRGVGEDEQVEKFYALLANIRAMRDMYRSGGAGPSIDSTGGGRKRARGSEPPWRPAFRMEDFEVAAGSPPERERRDLASRRLAKETDEAAVADGDDVGRKGRVVTPSS